MNTWRVVDPVMSLHLCSTVCTKAAVVVLVWWEVQIVFTDAVRLCHLNIRNALTLCSIPKRQKVVNQVTAKKDERDLEVSFRFSWISSHKKRLKSVWVQYLACCTLWMLFLSKLSKYLCLYSRGVTIHSAHEKRWYTVLSSQRRGKILTLLSRKLQWQNKSMR